jgi:COMPASS component SWD3
VSERVLTEAARASVHPSVDIDPEGGATILTGSWRQEEQLQLWDYGSGQLISTLEWGGKGERASPCMIYAAQFSADGRRIAAGGSGQNELRVFDARTLRCIGTAGDLSGGVYSLDWCEQTGQHSLTHLPMR